MRNKIWRRLGYYLGYLISLPVGCLFLLIFPLIKIRFIKLFSDRIGHYAMNTELLLCVLETGSYDKKDKFLFYTCFNNVPLCNTQLHLMWKRLIPIIFFPRIAFQIDKFLYKLLGERYKPKNIENQELPPGYQDTQNLLRCCKQHLFFTKEEQQQGQLLMNQLGISEGTPYICLVVRDSAYLAKTFPDRNWHYHNYRDADVATYQKAALFLAEKGYYVIRMGKTVGNFFEVDHPHIIDYANHLLRSDFLDIYLSAHCYFFISTCCGLDAVPQIFRRPILFTNVAPVSRQLQYWYPCELFITKKIRNKMTGELLSFKEINTIFKDSWDVQNILNSHHLELLENTEDEILEAVREMEAYMNKNWNESLQDQLLQEKFKKLLPFSMIADNDKLIANPKLFYAKLGTDFLRKNSALIGLKGV